MVNIPFEKLVGEILLIELDIFFDSLCIGIIFRRINSIAMAQGYKTREIVVLLCKRESILWITTSPYEGLDSCAVNKNHAYSMFPKLQVLI